MRVQRRHLIEQLLPRMSRFSVADQSPAGNAAVVLSTSDWPTLQGKNGRSATTKPLDERIDSIPKHWLDVPVRSGHEYVPNPSLRAEVRECSL